MWQLAPGKRRQAREAVRAERQRSAAGATTVFTLTRARRLQRMLVRRPLSLSRPQQKQLTAPGRREQRAVWTNRQFVRTHLDAPEHLASGWVDLHDIEFIIQRHALRMLSSMLQVL